MIAVGWLGRIVLRSSNKMAVDTTRHGKGVVVAVSETQKRLGLPRTNLFRSRREYYEPEGAGAPSRVEREEEVVEYLRSRSIQVDWSTVCTGHSSTGE